MSNQLEFNADGRLIIPKSIQTDYEDFEYSKKTGTPMRMIQMFHKVFNLIESEKNEQKK